MTTLRDPDAPPPSHMATLQHEPDERWQAARRRALERTDLHCERCGVEHGRRVRRYLYDRLAWWPIVPGDKPHRPDLGVVDVVVIVVPAALPWSGEDEDLQVLCMGCWIWREVEAAITRQRAGDQRVARQRLLELEGP